MQRALRTVLRLRNVRLVMLAVMAAAAVAAPARAGDEADRGALPVASIAVEGTVLKITLTDGRVLASPDLIGASLLVDQGDRLRRVRLDGIERDPGDTRRDVAPADVIWLHSFAVEASDGLWGPLCDSGPDSRRQAMPVMGRFSSANGRFGAGGTGSFELACSAGAMGKCIRFGYHPWQTRDLVSHRDGASVPAYLDLYNACIRMVRADYGGDGTATTKNGMLIDLYDDHDIQAPDGDHRMEFEAGWTQDGAVCVNHPRVKQDIALGDIAARWPRLAGSNGPSCTEATARSLGALLFNRSAP